MRILLVAEGDDELDGALRHLVERLVPGRHVFVSEDVRSPKLRVSHAASTVGTFHRRAEACLEYAEQHDFDALVFLVDQDGDRNRRREIDAAQDSVASPVRRACGLAIRSFDAWMLADIGPWRHLVGRAVPTTRSPETLRDPESHCAQHLDGTTPRRSRAEAYVEIAARCDLAVLERRCKKGFGVFSQRLRALAV